MRLTHFPVGFLTGWEGVLAVVTGKCKRAMRQQQQEQRQRQRERKRQRHCVTHFHFGWGKHFAE